MAVIPDRVSGAPYLVEALARSGGRSGGVGPLILAAVGVRVRVARNPSLAALAAHLNGGSGDGLVMVLGTAEEERSTKAWGDWDFIQGRAAGARKFSRPF